MTRITKPRSPTVRSGGGKSAFPSMAKPTGKTAGSSKGAGTTKPKTSTGWKATVTTGGAKPSAKPAARTVRAGGSK